jgi:hypothetical protein
MGRLLNPESRIAPGCILPVCLAEAAVSKRAILTDFERDLPVCAQSLNSGSLRATAVFLSVTYLGSPLRNGG